MYLNVWPFLNFAYWKCFYLVLIQMSFDITAQSFTQRHIEFSTSFTVMSEFVCTNFQKLWIFIFFEWMNDFPPFYFGPSVVLHCQIKLLCCWVGFNTVIWLILQNIFCYVWFTYVERFPIYLEANHFCHVPHYCMLKYKQLSLWIPTVSPNSYHLSFWKSSTPHPLPRRKKL